MFFRRWEILVNSFNRKNLETPASGRMLFFTKYGAENVAAGMLKWHYIIDGNRYGITYYVVKRRDKKIGKN